MQSTFSKQNDNSGRALCVGKRQYTISIPVNIGTENGNGWFVVVVANVVYVAATDVAVAIYVAVAASVGHVLVTLLMLVIFRGGRLM